jgi:hypothetical protein
MMTIMSSKYSLAFHTFTTVESSLVLIRRRYLAKQEQELPDVLEGYVGAHKRGYES